jgi:hypothetical protein
MDDRWHPTACGVVTDVQRRRSEHPPGSPQSAVWKEIGNSLYGKLAQGYNERRVFNSRHNQRETLKPSKVSSPFLAAHVTGLVRALISELLAFLPPHVAVVSVTTDAIITDAPLEDLSRDRPISAYFADLRDRIVGKPEVLEVKHRVAQLLPWRVRGVLTVSPGEGAIKLAKGGVQTPKHHPRPNDWMLVKHLERKPGDSYAKRSPRPFAQAHREAADYVFRETLTKFGCEFDWKRELLDPLMQVIDRPDLTSVREHLAAHSRPWPTVDDFRSVRRLFDDWRNKHGGQLKTLDDWAAWQNFRAGATASRAGVRRSEKGVVDQARRMLLRAWVRGRWGLPNLSYKEIADLLTTAGYKTMENDLKKAKSRDRDPQPRAIPSDAPGILAFVRTMFQLCPSFDYRQLVDGDLHLDADDPRAEAAE